MDKTKRARVKPARTVRHGGKIRRNYTAEELDYAKIVGRRIQEKRVQMNISQAVLAEKADVTIATQSRRENGQHLFTVADLLRYSHILGCEITEFFPKR
jgi:predicted transcriptional regulator